MKECDVMDINGTEYVVVDEIVNEGKNYVFLSDSNDPNNFLIKRSFMEEDGECIDDVTDNEFKKLLGLFYEKHKDMLEE